MGMGRREGLGFVLHFVDRPLDCCPVRLHVRWKELRESTGHVWMPL